MTSTKKQLGSDKPAGNRVKQAHRRERDENGLCAKDRIYRAFLMNPSITLEELIGSGFAPAEYTTVPKWLRAARKHFEANHTWEEARDQSNGNDWVPVATREMWNAAIAARNRTSPKHRDTEHDKRVTRELILNQNRPAYSGGENWLGHGSRGGRDAIVDYLLLDGATMERLLQERGAIREHFHHLKVDHDLLVTQDEDGLYRFDRRHLGIEVDPGNAKNSRQASFSPRQPDPFLRRKVEDAAVAETKRHFTGEGYTVDSFEPDNVGWDLEAVRGQELLRLEVKGLSGSEICVELTPNEYSKMQQYRDSYRICIVTDALTNPKLAVFEFSKDVQDWVDQNRRLLKVEEIIAARCRAVRA